MAERRPWNPPKVRDADGLCTMPDGEVRQAVHFALEQEDHEMIRQGYKCAWCLQVFDAAWPESCPMCGLPHDYWMRYYEENYAGEEWFGPRETGHDRNEALKHEKKKHFHEPGKQILVPGRDF
jgi:hypothetical protein